MNEFFELVDVTKRFGAVMALDRVSVRANEPSIVALVGKNGSGKTTLLRHIVGLQLPTSGRCVTHGRATDALGPAELARIGMAHQHDPLIGWMRGDQLLGYVASFYRAWDVSLEQRLVDLLEIELRAKISTMSPGNRQKMSIVVASCHHPSLLLLDEPLSDLDPIVRREVVEALLDGFRREDMTIVISSHLLDDLERIADRVVCMDRGRVIVDAALDTLQERYAEWTVTALAGDLPARFPEPFVVQQQTDRVQARLVVTESARHLMPFKSRYAVEIESRPLKLDQIFRILVGATNAAHGTPEAELRGRHAERAAAENGVR